ncbi:Dual specificity testis-specific protein kinase 2 [Chionoecetes opilio]|uniref:Dual specificity testis-specific protein kinase 2 n=1 Tax=Chionoecetes opilio TaxID=41210 RepID=A0A8J4YIC7_CHIOP|nr:Dual specificity testis-specific protein kinase 2 [Chionoecetes opilio]
MIARCEADPDILPRTHNFGVHYLDFYQMCQQDCPALFLQLAFMCCQIDPASRPSFEELKTKLEYLLAQLVNQSACCTARKLKVCHRRSQSDDTFKLLRNQMGEALCLPPLVSPPPAASPAVTPQEIVEKMSAADPYFQPSTGTVNPFALLKLPARSQLALQEGGRYCHSLPNYPLPAETSGMEANKHIHTSDSCLCHASPHCQCQGGHRHFSPHVENNRKHCQCLHSAKKFKVSEREMMDCKCKLTKLFCEVVGGGVDSSVSSLPRSDLGSGSEAASSLLHHSHMGGPVRRRGSGESGFFSVGDVERVGTPDLCLSYSELSTASLLSAEDEDANHHCYVQRSSSVITDSSEDLSSLGCCHDPLTCELSLCEGDDLMPAGRLPGYEVDTDIRQIVEFFERNIGSSGSDGPQRQSSRLHQGCLVPLLTHKFSTLHAGHRLAGIAGYSCQLHHNGSKASSYSTKDCVAPKQCRSRAERRDIFRVKDRPKVYITEGTVRAKRDIFEAK